MSRSDRRRRKYRSSYLPAGVKRLESGRNRTHLRNALRRDPDSIPLRDRPSMRWDVWSWD